VGYCPEERGILTSLSCEENLMLPPKVAEGGMSVQEIYDMFPNLKTRRNSPGGRLSGGEQQMLAVARILRTGARSCCWTRSPRAWHPSSCRPWRA
jgi:branched-chain amino acid transport system ATP-binding protein